MQREYSFDTAAVSYAANYASQLALYEKALKHIYNEDVVSKSIIFLHSVHSVSVS